jgi:hypothetical protein
MTNNLRKLKFATLSCLLMLAPNVVLSQQQAVAELTSFDRYGRIPWYEEKGPSGSFCQRVDQASRDDGINLHSGSPNFRGWLCSGSRNRPKEISDYGFLTFVGIE